MTRAETMSSQPTSNPCDAGPSDFSVPTVDISAYVGSGAAAQRSAAAAAMDRACRDVGFVQVTGHGVPEEVLAGLGAAMDAFFDLEPDVKLQWRRPATENRGYSPPRSESLSLSAGVESAARMRDFFEAFNVGASATDYAGRVPAELTGHYAETTWPAVPGFREAVEAYLAHARHVARTLTRIFEDALDLPTGWFGRLTDHPVSVLRMNNYALPAGTDVVLDGELMGMGEHTDYGIVTVLWADREPGLQVLDHDGCWHDVVPAAGALLVNLGDLTTRITNERWRSTLHRVKPPIVDGTIRRRRSAALFHDGDAEATVGPLAAFVDAEHPAAYAPVTIDEHVRAKLAGSRAGVLNPAADRERARLDRVR